MAQFFRLALALKGTVIFGHHSGSNIDEFHIFQFYIYGYPYVEYIINTQYYQNFTKSDKLCVIYI